MISINRQLIFCSVPGGDILARSSFQSGKRSKSITGRERSPDPWRKYFYSLFLAGLKIAPKQDMSARNWIVSSSLFICISNKSTLPFCLFSDFRLFGLFSKIIFNFKVVLYHSCFSYNTEIHKYSILSPKLLMKILKNIKPIMKLCDTAQ